MTQTLCFHNPGLLDPRLITLMGASVKVTDNPIGFFGTGLKYAIAVTLRLGGKIEIYTGKSKLEFITNTENIRGKDFNTILMNSLQLDDSDNWQVSEQTRLGFTLDLGKTWEPWMAYRELACNAKDEGGMVEILEHNIICTSIKFDEGTQEHTQILISCPEILRAHAERQRYFLQSTPLWANEVMEIHRKVNDGVYYRGLLVGKTSHPAGFTYNILEQMDLTEDRTLRYQWEIPTKCLAAIAECTDKAIIRSALLAPNDTFEAKFEYNKTSSFSDAFQQVAKVLVHNHSATMNRSARQLVKAWTEPEEKEELIATLAPVEQQMLDRALEFLKELELAPELERFPIKCYNSLGGEILGRALNDEIHLARRAFRTGTKCVAGTIWEEYIHLVHDYRDESRSMQNYLVDTVISLGEHKLGRPL